MPHYLVERFLPGDAEARLAEVSDRARGSAQRLRSQGIQVRFLGSTLVPEDQMCFCLFEAPSLAVVRRANEEAGLAFERILSALWFVGERGGTR